MRIRLAQKLRSLTAVLCLTALTLINSSAGAEEGDQVDSCARAAVLIERNTGMVLLRHNETEPLPMASTTKVMTALMALEYGRLDEVVTVGRNAYGVPGTSIYLSLGEKITLRDLLYGLMLASGNDAAVAIAEHIGGSVDAFCQKMTQRAAEIGCENTVFVNPNGLPVQGHHTTAFDLALIAREAMRYDLFREIVSTKRASIPWEGRSYNRILNNKNRLLSDYEGATGIKTGYTKAAGRCLVFGARRNGLEVIGVVLNCGDWFNEAARLMDMGFERYECFTALSEGETVRELPITDGTQDTTYICAQGDLCAAVPRGEVPTLEYDMPDTLSAGMKLGDIVGEARLMLNGRTLASVPLVLSESLRPRDFGFELERVIQGWPLLERQAVGE
ncbi:MAG: D-alanyl-D-alanine carboxypeptidase [Clostridiales bacterium]|nr:D-alanyl-D-alanine carboxypeptidase [Clostridiales bacterium]MDO4349744.1 D-alanyl-D-alanine carboxypeptidase family protein [Eubacteriales bacterium]MDY4007944.1 D-alanyl-D-alanine carboxypeptidase family protein [Candidatus Limiplasma sp.]